MRFEVQQLSSIEACMAIDPNQSASSSRQDAAKQKVLKHATKSDLTVMASQLTLA
jgi:hypothetical protein